MKNLPISCGNAPLSNDARIERRRDGRSSQITGGATLDRTMRGQIVICSKQGINI